MSDDLQGGGPCRQLAAVVDARVADPGGLVNTDPARLPVAPGTAWHEDGMPGCRSTSDADDAPGNEVLEKAFTGEFETHLTVRLREGDEPSLLRWAECNGLKYTRIVLDRGQAPDQPMLTTSGRGTLALQRDAAAGYVGQLRGGGFEVTRVKIEAAPWNEDVPQTARDAAVLPPHCYFEHHIKLVLADADQVSLVRALCEPHAAHVSLNARRRLGKGCHERFVTQRCRRVGRPAARKRLNALLASLARAGFAPVEVEEEFVVHDDNMAMDADWITPGEGDAV